MKKQKIFLSVLLLILCVGIVGIGVYASVPSNSTLGGTVHITPPNSNVEISGYINGEQILAPTQSVYGVDLTIPTLAISHNSKMSGVCTKLTIHIKNLSNKNLGVYFYSGEEEKTTNTLAVGSDIKTSDTLRNILNVNLTSYSYLKKADDSSDQDEISMDVFFSIRPGTNLNVATNCSFSYYLNMEEYAPSEEISSLTTLPSGSSQTAGTTISDTLVKLPEAVSQVPAYAFSSNIKHVALTPSTTTISSNAFKGKTSLNGINLNNVTTIGDYAFNGCSSFKGFANLTSATSVGEYAFNGSQIFDVINTQNLATVGQHAFSGCNQLTSSLSFASGATIGEYAFNECQTLISLDLENVTSIGQYAFADCKNVVVSSLNLSNATNIGVYAFSGCVKIFGDLMLDNVTSIGVAAFKDCNLSNVYYAGTLKEWFGIEITSNPYIFESARNLYINNVLVDGTLTVPSDVTSVGAQFTNYKKITGLNLSNVTSVGPYAFNGCTGITGSVNMSKLNSVGFAAFNGCSGISGEVNLTGLTDVIGDFAFRGCSAITSLTIGASATRIGSDAFDGCSRLQTATINSESIAQNNTYLQNVLAGTAIENVYVIQVAGADMVVGSYLTTNFLKMATSDKVGYTLYVNIGETYSVDASGVGSEYTFTLNSASQVEALSTMTLSSTAIGTASLTKCTDASLVNAKIPAYVQDPSGNIYAVTAIADGASGSNNAFSACASSLQTITLPKTLTTIGTFAFYHCTGLTGEIDLSNVVTLKNSSFAYCNNIEKFYLRDLQTLDANAFNTWSLSGYAATVAEIDYQKTLEDWLNIEISVSLMAQPFAATRGLYINGELLQGEITIPNSILSLGGNFSGYKKLTRVNLNNVTSIGGNAFDGCTGLTQIDLAGVTTIGDRTFYGCTGLIQVDLAGVTSIGNNAFSGTGLQTIYISNGVTSIGSGCFSNCIALTEIILDNETIANDNTQMGYLVGSSGQTVYLKSNITYTGTYLSSNNFTLQETSDLSGYVSYAKFIQVDAAGAGSTYKFVLNDEDYTARLSAIYGNTLKTAYIPSKIQTPNGNIYTVTAIDGHDNGASGRVFANVYNVLTSAFLPKTVKTIAENAFQTCTKLATLDLNSVETIGINAFQSCSALTKVYYSKTLKDWCNVNVEIGTSMLSINSIFNSNTSFYISGELLQGELIIPDGVTSLTGNFAGYKKITSVDLNGVTTIGDYAFNGCNLTGEINLSNVTQIGQSAFTASSTFSRVIYNKTLTNWLNVSVNSCVFASNTSFVVNGEEISGLLIIPDGITNIGLHFSGYTKITGVDLNDVITIDSTSFNGCSNLTNIILNNQTIANNNTQMSYLLTNSATIFVYINSDINYTGDFLTNCDFEVSSTQDKVGYVKYSIVEPYTVNSDGVGRDYTFQLVPTTGTAKLLSCTNASIINATIPTRVKDSSGKIYKVTEIGSSYSSTPVFTTCASTLKSVIIPGTVTTLNSSAFSGCVGLTEITIGENITSINSSMLSGCTNLTTMILNSQTIADNSLSLYSLLTNSSITTVYLKDGLSSTNLTNNGFVALEYSNKEGYVIYSKNAYSVDETGVGAEYTFTLDLTTYTASLKSCTNASIINVIIPTSVVDPSGNRYAVTSIESGSDDNHGIFKNWDIQTVLLPKTLTGIGANAFWACSSLTSINLGNVIGFSRYAFYNCTGLTYVDISSATHIYSSAFRGCSGLTKMDLSGVQMIGESAFLDCGITGEVDLSSVTTIGSGAFSGTAISGVVDLSSVTTIMIRAFNSCSGITEVKIGSMATSFGTDVFVNCSNLATVILDSSTIANNSTYMGYLLANSATTTVYLKNGLSSTQLVSKGFSESATQDKTGYVKYTK